MRWLEVLEIPGTIERLSDTIGYNLRLLTRRLFGDCAYWWLVAPDDSLITVGSKWPR